MSSLLGGLLEAIHALIAGSFERKRLSKVAALHQSRVQYRRPLDLEPTEFSYFWEGWR